MTTSERGAFGQAVRPTNAWLETLLPIGRACLRRIFSSRCSMPMPCPGCTGVRSSGSFVGGRRLAAELDARGT
ncbi:hypothetical protein ABC974_07935 [Sphingomonas oligophenolica]|uniref:Uncharacterized protein n=1 Tax=Sphingomonas oligophenolica TaxID=301154 RepID=A0ABU9Y160_9SPHN